jgi:hypothetical protein
MPPSREPKRVGGIELMAIEGFSHDGSFDGRLFLLLTDQPDGWFLGKRRNGQWFTDGGEPAAPRYFYPIPLTA